jgi:hypothetical protein
LRFACHATHSRAIVLGRECLLEVDRAWLVLRIETIATGCVDLNDEWDYSRLLEVYRLLNVQS